MKNDSGRNIKVRSATRLVSSRPSFRESATRLVSSRPSFWDSFRTSLAVALSSAAKTLKACQKLVLMVIASALESTYQSDFIMQTLIKRVRSQP